MALAVLAVVPAAYATGLHYFITVRDGSPFILVPVALSFPFVLRAIIRGWLRTPPRVRPTVPELSGPSPSEPQAVNALPQTVSLQPLPVAHPLDQLTR